MALTLYKKKRSFKITPEPTGGKSTSNQLRFVIQKHAASRLHYDLRLEMDGVLKSWAVPKGPSTDPAVKRLAMMVEDHPYNYRNFEGIIPQGQYGGGTVIVWDEGTYEPIEEITTKKAQEKLLTKQLVSGSLKFRLHGKKLKGEFALVHTRGQGDNAWLLIKHRDAYANTTDITKKEKSVLTGKTIKQVEKTSDNLYGQTKRPSAKAQKETVKNGAAKKVAPKKINSPKGKKATFPRDVTPMLATLVDKPFDEEGWLYEVKWDGYRALAYLNKGKVAIRSRNNVSFNEKFYAVYDVLKKWDINAVLDGELIVADKTGISNFGSLQNWRSEADGELKYYVFDILWLDGNSLMELPLSERRDILRHTIHINDTICISENFDVTGTAFYATAQKLGLEGMIAKKAASEYIPGARSKEWLKIKTNKRHEVVIGGFTKNEDSSKPFSSLLVGVYEKGKLNYIGKIGTGFSVDKQREMMAQFKPLVPKKIPFHVEPDVNKSSRFRPNPPKAKATWLQPRLVCEVSYAELTADGVMRHPSFAGMRMDKAAKQVVLEKETGTALVINKKNNVYEKKVVTGESKSGRKTFLNPADKTQVRKINGHELTFTNLDKLYWSKEKITKRDMLNYYYQAAPYMLPYMKNRPQSLNRHPNGINGKSFYQKDVTGKVPGWVKTFPYSTEGVDKNFMVCTDEASILYIASLGCIEMNPWSSRIQSPDNPDWCIIDLDPDNNSFDQVIEVANIVKQVLDSAGVDCYCKTSGSTGLHIYIPLGAKYTYEESKEFARLIVTMVAQQLPKHTSIERTIAKRKGKIYLDFLQNRPGATLATVYSLRPKPEATVSMPLHWEEVIRGLKMKDFTIQNAISRIRAEGDIFKAVLGKGINMKKALVAIQNL